MITPTFNLERQAEVLARAQKHGQDLQESGGARRMARAWSIAVTREAGTPGTSVAQDVGKRLGWPVYDRELIENIAREMGLRANLLESVDERGKSWLTETFEALCSTCPVSESKFVKHLVETLVSLSAIGHSVIVGRGAAQILPMECTLRVRLVGSKADRVEAVQRHLHVSHEEAARWVEKTDHERMIFVREHFLKDPNDASQYDLVLNTSRWSASECVEFILKAIAELEKRR